MECFARRTSIGGNALIVRQIMEIETIIQELSQRFAAPLPEFYKRRVIFWRDEEEEFKDKFFEVQLKLPVKFIQLNGHNNFEAKKLLEHDDLDSDYLVYDPVNYLKQDDDWLLGLRLMSEEFRSDIVTMWMDEMHLPAAISLRQTIKENRKFFNAKERREKIAALQKTLDDAGKIRRAVLAVLCGIDSIVFKDILKAILLAGLDHEGNKIYQAIQNYSLEKFFWDGIGGAGYRSETPTLREFFRFFVLTATAKTLPQEYLCGLEKFFSPHRQHQAICYDILSDWLRETGKRSAFLGFIRDMEDELQLLKRLKNVPVKELIQADSMPCIDESILAQLFKGIQDHSILPDDMKSIVARRRTMVWHDLNAEYYTGAWECAEILAFQHEHAQSFHTMDPKRLWKEYTEDYYRMDCFYRKFHLAFHKTLAHPNPVLDDAFKGVAETVEGIYSHWFLGELGGCWVNACQDNLKDTGKIADIPQQEDFYSQYITSAGNKVYVVISDGLRYEVAAQAAEELRRETQSEVTLNSCQGIFPTSTKFGMAALLPHKQLSAVAEKTGVSILADGEPTESPFRERILQQSNPNSAVLLLSKIKSMKRAERLDLVRGKEVIYIYADSIDQTGHSSPTGVFDACEEAIADIKEAVRIIVNDFCAHHICITSDHGFLYTYRPLQEDEKVDKGISKEQTVEIDSRYLITTRDAAPEHLLPICFLHNGSDFSAFAPRENIRIKKHGGYTNYVHGGISPQEMVVPVIYYHFLRNSLKGYRDNPEKYDTLPVSLQLLSASRKITNMVFSLSFYQKEPIGDNREAATYLLYFVDSDGQRISDEQKVIANSPEKNEQERTFRCNFNLKSREYRRTDPYYLVIADETGLQLPVKETFQIDIAFAVESFGFFSE